MRESVRAFADCVPGWDIVIIARQGERGRLLGRCEFRGSSPWQAGVLCSNGTPVVGDWGDNVSLGARIILG